ncbi:MAG: hypothetical protein A3I66_19075 [Burkholderiales bacterium RIFCSPLOWO2_02_FULL_57_36]|nr:MAG: hypothetical protein A3I66_19075 [Burkholderiales bacterium RIFCSPLOWO2_02_FULL_57_36]
MSSDNSNKPGTSFAMAAFMRQQKEATRRINAPAAYLEEANKIFSSVTRGPKPLWRKRLPAWMTRFDRTIVVELLPSLVLRVRDPKSGQILAESVAGQLDVLNSDLYPEFPADI